MRIQYDGEVNALYIQLGNQKPDGVIELSEGINLDTTADNKIVGIEILKASERIDIKTILSYTIDSNEKILASKVAWKTGIKKKEKGKRKKEYEIGGFWESFWWSIYNNYM